MFSTCWLRTLELRRKFRLVSSAGDSGALLQTAMSNRGRVGGALPCVPVVKQRWRRERELTPR
ncbi:unnamed protein product [Ascophyllum nodosum]